MDIVEDGGVKPVLNSATTSKTKASEAAGDDSMNSESSKVKDSAMSQNGSTRPGSPPGMGYLTLSGGCLTIKKVSGDKQKAVTTVNGCDPEGETDSSPVDDATKKSADDANDESTKSQENGSIADDSSSSRLSDHPTNNEKDGVDSVEMKTSVSPQDEEQVETSPSPDSKALQMEPGSSGPAETGSPTPGDSRDIEAHSGSQVEKDSEESLRNSASDVEKERTENNPTVIPATDKDNQSSTTSESSCVSTARHNQTDSSCVGKDSSEASVDEEIPKASTDTKEIPKASIDTKVIPEVSTDTKEIPQVSTDTKEIPDVSTNTTEMSVDQPVVADAADRLLESTDKSAVTVTTEKAVVAVTADESATIGTAEDSGVADTADKSVIIANTAEKSAVSDVTANSVDVDTADGSAKGDSVEEKSSVLCVSESGGAAMDQSSETSLTDKDTSSTPVMLKESSPPETGKVDGDSTVTNATSPSSQSKSVAHCVGGATQTSSSTQVSPSKSTARKSLPGGGVQTKLVKVTARKTGKPQSMTKAVVTSTNKKSGEGTIKIVNLHPNSNITLRLSELEEVLKVKEVSAAKSNYSEKRGNSAKSLSGSDQDSNSLDTIPHTTVHQEGFMQLNSKYKRRRKRGGTYDFPGGKKTQKKKKGGGSTPNSDSRDEEGVDDLSALRKVSSKPMSSSQRKQSTVMELLYRNRASPFLKRHTSHEALMRRKSGDSPLKVKRTVSQMLQDRRKIPSQSGDVLHVEQLKQLQERQQMRGLEVPVGSKDRTVCQMLEARRRSAEQQLGTATNAGEKRRMVQKLFVTKDGLVSSVNVEDVSEEENVEKPRGLKRKFSVGTSLLQPGSPDGPGSKKLKLAEGDEVQQQLVQPMVMVVAQHSQNTPGLRSILPKPNVPSAITVSGGSLVPSSSGAVVVSGGQKLLLSGQSFMVKPGTKVAFVPAPSGKNTFSLLPTSSTSSSTSPRGSAVMVPTSSVQALSKVVNIRHAMTQANASGNTTDALRALLATSSSGGPRLKTSSQPVVSMPMGHRLMSVPSGPLSSSSYAQVSRKVLSTMTSTSSSSPMTSTSGSKCEGGDGKGLASVPNGLLFPSTPPKLMPEGEATAEGMTTTPSPSSDVLPLCCCKVVGAFFTKMTSGATYCQALDSVGDKILGCCNKVSNLQLVRPGVKIPFMAVCEVHRKRLKLHQCCPGCGHFCTQGKFYQCRNEGSSVHNFHRQCQTERDGRLFCPHCGEESGQVEVTLALNEPKQAQSTEQIRANLRKSMLKARMTPGSLVKKKTSDTQQGVSYTLPNSKTITTDGVPFGPDRENLEKLMHLCSSKAERPKKYRVLPKNMYDPASEGDLEKVFYMLVDNMDPNQICEEEDNQTVLHGAVYSGNLTLVYLLMQAGACLHTPDKTLKTALMCAAEYGHLAILKLLAKAGARLDDRGEDRMTCLHYAAKAGHLDVISYILDINAVEVNSTDEGGWTPMMWATEAQLVDVVKFLVSRGGDPSKKDNEENTALHWAAFAGSIEITELYLDLGCELDTPNEHGDRPLHIAARRDHYEVVVILLARGANVDLKNNNDETPVNCCPDQDSQVCMALKVNKQLRSFAAKLTRTEKLVHRDVSLGRERHPIACVNAFDDEPHPSDYLYVDHNVETQDLHINNVITSLQSCQCKDDCSSVYCVCSRSSVKCWFDKMGRLIEDFNLLDPPHIFECNRACRCWVNCNNRVVQNGITVRLQVFRTNGRGFGVRSLMDVPKGTFICEYIGELISDSEADRREDDSYLFDLDNKDGDTYCLDARKYGNVARFINHLCEPNLVPVKVFVEHQDLRFPRICFFSSRDIKAYEELGFDYGEKFWIIKWKQFTCACGSPKCKYSTETISRTLEEYRLRHEDEDLNQDS